MVNLAGSESNPRSQPHPPSRAPADRQAASARGRAASARRPAAAAAPRGAPRSRKLSTGDCRKRRRDSGKMLTWFDLRMISLVVASESQRTARCGTGMPPLRNIASICRWNAPPTSGSTQSRPADVGERRGPGDEWRGWRAAPARNCRTGSRARRRRRASMPTPAVPTARSIAAARAASYQSSASVASMMRSE
jgi:hypothetical protein